MPVGCKKAYIARGLRRTDVSTYKEVEKVFLAWGEEHAPVVARKLARDLGFSLQKVLRVSDTEGYVEIPLE